ncbi:hypothetical protein [Clostridium aminobutyricum]|uniref:Uncharacterized protein n=1 Tax=Clostridium aminobutyricum TaxID=33953 RepID=A0A939IKA7_CLOAM|nr:hypothetical protein [Clostridium aminobutyricum]MBN7774448.1 hypothetical protein [Clostridium aminobutyricum]
MKDIEELEKKSEKILTLDENTILTPAARDLAKERGFTVMDENANNHPQKGREKIFLNKTVIPSPSQAIGQLF